MGCSSSAQTQVKECIRPASKSPDTNGLQKCDDSLPTTEENDTISDQTKLIPTEEAEHGSHGTKLSEGFVKEESDVLIPEMTGYDLSTCERVDPEGTEPQPLAPEEKFDSSGPLPISLLEAGEPLPVEPSKDVIHEPQDANEAVNCLVPETVQDNMPESVESSQQDTPEPLPEDCADLVTEVVKELQLSEEELQTEDNKCLATDTEGETEEKMETEMHQETVSEGSETKEEETGEATAAATEETEAKSEE